MWLVNLHGIRNYSIIQLRIIITKHSSIYYIKSEVVNRQTN